MCSVGGLLGAVTLRVRIVAIRIIVVWGAGIHSVQDNAEKVTFDAEKQVARANKGFLGSFSAAHNKKNAVGLDREDHRVGGGHNRRGIEHDELIFAAELGNGVGELVGRKQVRGIGR